MPRLIAIAAVNRIANLAFNVNEDSSRAELDQALIDDWTAQYGAVALISDPDVRAEPGDTWDGSQGVAPPTVVVSPPSMPVALHSASGPLNTNSLNMLQVAPEPRVGSEVIYGTHNFSDPTTWFADSVRVVDEQPDETDGITYQLDHVNVINLNRGKIFDDRQYKADQQADNPGDPHAYQVVVKVDGVEMTPRPEFTSSGGDYYVDCAAGQVIFEQSQTGNLVGVSYSYANGSSFYITPDPGFRMAIEKAKVMFTSDFVMNDAVQFTVYGYAAVFAPQLGLPEGTRIPLTTTQYETFFQLQAEADEMLGPMAALGGSVRGTQSPFYILKFRYGTVRSLSGSAGIQLCVKMANDLPNGGENTSATFYCVVHSES